MNLGLNNPAYVKGFTLIELIVSIAVMGIMSVILFVRYPETVKRLTLTNITNSSSLTIHEAQVRGSAIDSINSSIGGYGVYFSLTNMSRIVLFGDQVNGTVSPYQIYVGDGLYENSPTDEAVRITTLPDGYTFAKLCIGNTSTTTFTCNSDNIPAINSLTISFTRPNPQPNIYINNTTSGAVIPSACIEFHSILAPTVGHVRSVQVFSSGIIRRVNAGCQ